MSNHRLAVMFKSWIATLLIAFTALFAAGCSTTRVIDSEVTSFHSWGAAPPGPGTTYRLERLPSQQALSAQHSAVEAAARYALAKAGMVPSDTAPRYSVQVLLSTQIIEQVLADPFGYGGFWPWAGYDRFGGARFAGYGAFGYGARHSVALGLGFPLGGYQSTTLRHELAVLMRDTATQQLAFETRAHHDGPWRDTLAMLPALLDAALLGFPQPPPGARRVNVMLQPTAALPPAERLTP